MENFNGFHHKYYYEIVNAELGRLLSTQHNAVTCDVFVFGEGEQTRSSVGAELRRPPP